MSRTTLALALLLAPAVAGAVPRSPGLGKRFLGAYTDRVHPSEVRRAIELSRSMSDKGLAQQALINRVRTLAPRLSVWSFRRLLAEMHATEAQTDAVGHYVDHNARELSPRELLSTLSSVQPSYPDAPLHPGQQITHEATTSARRAVLMTTYRLQKTTYEKKLKAADELVAQSRDALLLRYVRNRHFGGPPLTAADLALLARGARLPSTRQRLEQEIVELTRTAP